jgi:SAM-dependent methyltransferase
LTNDHNVSETSRLGRRQVSLYTAGYARFYEEYYTSWVRQTSPILRSYLADRIIDKSLLDLCCGTGETVTTFASNGWEVDAVDASRGMLDRLTEQLTHAEWRDHVRLHEADAASFRLPRQVGAAVCLDGALNHLMSPEWFQEALARVSEALLPGAIFIFDLYELPHFELWDAVSVLDVHNALIVKRGVWDRSDGSGLRRFSGGYGSEGDWQRVSQTVTARHYDESLVWLWLQDAGFSRVESGVNDLPPCPCGAPTSSRCRTMYVALRNAA